MSERCLEGMTDSSDRVMRTLKEGKKRRRVNRRIDGREEGGENEASDGWKLNYSTLVDQGYLNYQRYFIRGFHIQAANRVCTPMTYLSPTIVSKVRSTLSISR